LTNTPATIETADFTTDSGLGTRGRIGLIVLQSDQTIEHEVASLLGGDDIAIYHARIPNAMEVTPDTLRQMETDLPHTASLLPPSFAFNAIGYACTSGATLIGEDRVDQIIRQIHPDAKTSNPITATKKALAALNVKRIALLTPYAPEVTTEMQQNLRDAGFYINAVASFNESDDFTVARITSDSIYKAVLSIGSREDCDGVFVSCTSLRALEIIAQAEQQLDKPVISSNQALAWHLAHIAGIESTPPDAGRLFKLRGHV